MIKHASVVAVVQLPPPITGLSSVNAKMVEALDEEGILEAVVNVAPGPGVSGLRKVLDRGLKTLATMAILIRSRIRGSKTLYMPCDGGAGLVLNIAIAVTARTLGYRVYIHHHSFAYINKHAQLMAWLILSLPRGTTHIVLCEDMGLGLSRAYAKYWKSAQCRSLVLPNAFMVNEGALTPTVKPSVLTIGHLSNLTIAKGAIRFLDLFNTLRSQGVAINALLAGPVQEEEVKIAIERTLRDHPDAFQWLGPTHGAQKNAFYERLHVFAFPSDYANEAQPVVLLEALSHNAAILATERGCVTCDHAASPGLVVPIAVFHTEAVEWLKAYATDSKARIELAEKASKQFSAMRIKASKNFTSLLAEFQLM